MGGAEAGAAGAAAGADELEVAVILEDAEAAGGAGLGYSQFHGSLVLELRISGHEPAHFRNHKHQKILLLDCTFVHRFVIKQDFS